MLTDVQMDERVDGKLDPFIAPCLRQARQKCRLSNFYSLYII